jgi:hypothetical protein
VLFNLPLQAIELHYNFLIGRIAFVLSYVQSTIKNFTLEYTTQCIRHTNACAKCATQPAHRSSSMYHLGEFMFVCLFVCLFVVVVVDIYNLSFVGLC